LLPTTACLVQKQLGLPTSCGALDINLGCSGYIYGLSVAKGLIETGQARNVLLVTADTYSKLLHPEDKSVRAIFGDGAAATWLTDTPNGEALGPFVFGTDGGGAHNLIAQIGGVRSVARANQSGPANTVWAKSDFLQMNGPEIFNFTLRVVPDLVQRLLAKAQITTDQIDLFVLHQANAYMIEHLREKLGLPPEKTWLFLRDCGNTVSSSIPLALKGAQEAGRLAAGARLMLLGFGVGYSWAGCVARWQ